jgi:hypothetical protein
MDSLSKNLQAADLERSRQALCLADPPQAPPAKQARSSVKFQAS